MLVVGGGYVGGLAPQEVTRLVAAHVVHVALLVLVGLHGEGVGRHACGASQGVVAVDVHVRVLVLPVDGTGGCPLPCGIVVGVAHVVGAVLIGLQGAWLVALIVHHIHAHLVTIGKAFVVDACHGQLLYVGLQRDWAAAAALLVGGQLVGGAGQGGQQGAGYDDVVQKVVACHVAVCVCDG